MKDILARIGLALTFLGILAASILAMGAAPR